MMKMQYTLIPFSKYVYALVSRRKNKKIDLDKYPFEWFVKEEFRRMEETGSRLPSAFHYPDFIRHGLYSEQLERYLQYFSPEQILILESKSLKTDKRNILNRGMKSFLS